MTITYALMEKLEEISTKSPEIARVYTKACVTKLIQSNGVVSGVEYEKDGQTFTEHGVVIVATGGYGADFSDDSLLKKYRPDLLHLPTTNGDHCTGDGIKLALEVGANPADLEWVQVHPTGLVDPKEPDAKLKFLAAEALRGVGGLLLNKDGDRFCNELGHRDYVTAQMWKNAKGPYRLVLNGAGSKEIEWHCKHYVGRGLMKKFNNGAALAAEMGIPTSKLETLFKKYNEDAKANKDAFEKKFFHNLPFDINDEFHVAIVTPVIHYCMGGIEINDQAAVTGPRGPIPGLFATGEVCGGVHGENRLGGNSLLDCVVLGRVSGASAARYILQSVSRDDGGVVAAQRRIAGVVGHVVPRVTIAVEGQRVTVTVGDDSTSAPSAPVSAPKASTPAPAASKAADNKPAAAAAPAAAKADRNKVWTKEEVAKHNKETDCWVIVNGQVLNVTSFLKDHPGGKKAILLFAGKDATEEFNMLHKPDVVDKYAPESVIGVIAK